MQGLVGVHHRHHHRSLFWSLLSWGWRSPVPFRLIFLLFPLIGLVYWFFRKFLPRWILGEVVAEFPVTSQSVPVKPVQGELTIEPKKGVSINGIALLFQAREQCVSGSGSNRTTHKHVILRADRGVAGGDNLGRRSQTSLSIRWSSYPVDARSFLGSG